MLPERLGERAGPTPPSADTTERHPHRTRRRASRECRDPLTGLQDGSRRQHRRRPSVRVARTHERDQAVRYMVVNSTNTVQAPVYARVAALTGTRRSSAAWSTTVPLSL